MKKTLLNCDQVFDVLTRGPFPSGDPEDEAVERHLRACHECRQLAEALRPAVSLLHEAISSDEALELPEYQGALPWKRPERRQRLSMARLAKAAERRNLAEPPTPVVKASRISSGFNAITALRVVAASLLVFASGALIFAITFAPGGAGTRFGDGSDLLSTRRIGGGTDGVPTANGLITLAALNLPKKCVPESHRPVSAEHASMIAAALASGELAALHCCTECHHAGLPQPKAARLVVLAQQNCQACHRG